LKKSAQIKLLLERNFRPYLYVVKIRVLLAMTYRFEVIISVLTSIIVMLVTALVWRTAFSGIDQVAGVNETQMLKYSIMAIILAGIYSFSIEDNMRQKIRNGNVSVDYIKPVKVFLMYFLEDVGGSTVYFFQKAIPILITASLIVVVPLPASLPGFMLFLLSAALSYLIMWYISAIFALLYFKAINLGPLGAVKNHLILILSGSFVPIWFFPEYIQRVLQFLPFIYIYQLPLGIFVGRYLLHEAITGMAIQAVWCTFFMLAFLFYGKRVTNNLLIQGG